MLWAMQRVNPNLRPESAVGKGVKRGNVSYSKENALYLATALIYEGCRHESQVDHDQPSWFSGLNGACLSPSTTRRQTSLRRPERGIALLKKKSVGDILYFILWNW